MSVYKPLMVNESFSHLQRRTALKAMGGVSVIALLGFPQITMASEVTQQGWRWCSKCQGMFYAASSGAMHMGVCPAGGNHIQTGSGHYLEQTGIDDPKKSQAGWSWCNKCQGFFYSRASQGAGGMGHCPAGGTHSKDGSGNYIALIGEDGPRQQGGWRWCDKCMGMFYSRASAGKGVCPAGGAHSDAASGHYATLFTP